MSKVTCDYCDNTLKRYGKWTDWSHRNLHFKCYKIQHEKAILAITMETYLRGIS